MPSIEILRIRNCIHETNNIFSFKVNIQICQSKNCRTKTGKTGLRNSVT